MLDLFALVHNSNHFENEFSGAEVLLPVQFHDRPNSASTGEPLRRLMVAMLVDAIRSFRRNSTRVSRHGVRIMEMRGRRFSLTMRS
jgi:hypothetical protein